MAAELTGAQAEQALTPNPHKLRHEKEPDQESVQAPTTTTSGVVTASTNMISGVVPVMTLLLPIRTIDQELENS